MWGEVGVKGGLGLVCMLYVESPRTRPHVLTSLFRANEDGCRVFRGKNREGGGGKETRAGSLKEGGDGKEGVWEDEAWSEPKGDGERRASRNDQRISTCASIGLGTASDNHNLLSRIFLHHKTWPTTSPRICRTNCTHSSTHSWYARRPTLPKLQRLLES
jgi:hypothetical protein